MSDRRLEPLPLGTGAAVLAALPALRDALRGSGPALLPHPADQAPPAALRPGEPLLTSAGMHPGRVTDGQDEGRDDGPDDRWDGVEDDPADPTVAVLATSGSTGTPKGALLQASALLASASATHDRLGGPGRWLLALPAAHVAGLQVLVRSLVSRTVPHVMDLADGFTAQAFAEAAALTTGPRRYTSLVPTQLVRVLDAGGAAVQALAGFDAVLVGGAATSPSLLDRARAAGVAVVTTYGMSETCGGCVYDGVPLDGVRVTVDAGGRVSVGGPVVARGYRRSPGLPAAFAAGPDGTRWFRTDDAGALGPDGTLTVLGRVDDAVLTGGLTVLPSAVEAALHAMPGVSQAVVVGVPDEEWGQRVVAAVVPDAVTAPPTLAQVRAHVARALDPAAAPRQLLTLDRLPLRGPGKPDRAEIARRAASGEGVRVRVTG